jgi:hypothetical protein
MPGKIDKKDVIKAGDASRAAIGGMISQDNMLTIQQAIDRKMTIKEVIEARGIKDPKGYLKKAAMEKGIDINKSIMEYKHFDKIKEFYKKPIILEEQNVLDELGQVATVAILAAVVAIVVAPYVLKSDMVIRNIREAAIKEINTALK